MRNGAKRRRPMAPKPKKTANDGMGSVVPEYRQNRDGTFCGPYYYWYRYEAGRRTKTYLPREEGEKKQAELAEIRKANKVLREFLEVASARRDPDRPSGSGTAPTADQPSPTGRYWHGSQLRASRKVPTEERDRSLFNHNREEIRADLGFPITEDDYVELLKMVRSELARLSQQGTPWREGVALELDLSQLPSRRRLQGDSGDETD